MGFKISTIYGGITANNAYVKDLIYTNKDEIYKIDNDYFIRCVEAYPTYKAFESGHKPVLALAIFNKNEPYIPLFATHLGGEIKDWFGTIEGQIHFDEEIEELKTLFNIEDSSIKKMVENFNRDIQLSTNDIKKEIKENVLYQAYISHTDKGMSGGVKKYVNEVPLARETNDDTQKSMTFDNKEDAGKWLKDEFDKTSLGIIKENDEQEEDYLL